MARYDFRAPRLYLNQPLAAATEVALDRGQANYLLNVMRLKAGEAVLVFNGRDGEWRACLSRAERRMAGLEILERVREQTPRPEVVYLFAPLKHARLDYMVQKAVEMGAGVLQPVVTRHTVAGRVNLERMRANVIEAAEQCGIIALPEVRPPAGLEAAVADFEAAHPGRPLVFCDEEAEGDPLAVLAGLKPGPLAVLVGPEGGFAAQERAMLKRPGTVAISLGPRILRADTAAVAALALAQAALGDWRGQGG